MISFTFVEVSVVFQKSSEAAGAFSFLFFLWKRESARACVGSVESVPFLFLKCASDLDGVETSTTGPPADKFDSDERLPMSDLRMKRDGEECVQVASLAMEASRLDDSEAYVASLGMDAWIWRLRCAVHVFTMMHDQQQAFLLSFFFFLHAEKKLKDLKRPLPGDIGRPAVKSMLRSLESSRKDHMDRLLSERDDYSGCAVVSNQAEAGGGFHDDDSEEPRCGCCLPLYHWLLPHKQAVSSDERLLLIETDELQRDESETEGLLDDDDGGGDNGWCKGALIMVYYRAAYITMKFKTKHMYILGKHQSSKLSKNDCPTFIYFAQRISAKNPAMYIILLETELSCKSPSDQSSISLSYISRLILWKARCKKKKISNVIDHFPFVPVELPWFVTQSLDTVIAEIFVRDLISYFRLKYEI